MPAMGCMLALNSLRFRITLQANQNVAMLHLPMSYPGSSPNFFHRFVWELGSCMDET